MSKVEERHKILQSLELLDIHSLAGGDESYDPEVEFSDYDFELQDNKNWEQIKDQPMVVVYDLPDFLTPDETLNYFQSIQSEEGDNGLNLADGFKGQFGLNKNRYEAAYSLVAFSLGNYKTPIGFTNFKVTFDNQVEDSESSCHLHVIFDYRLTYVSPEYRGLGYGYALAVKRGEICTLQLKRLIKLLRNTDFTIYPVSISDWMSEGGSKTTKISNVEIETFIDEIIDEARERNMSSNIKQLDIDAGF